jgi:D-xylose 1-dehydrogenase (NADP+, D-xylono-1,5-lactone-forming)
MSIEPVRWGILSTADINRLVIPPAQASPEVDLVGVASRGQARADVYAREWGIPRAYASYEELLADDEIEAVYISLPNHLHVEWSIRSLEAGKHVLCEKPFSRHPDQVEAAFDVAEQSGLLLSEAFMWRHNPQAQLLAALLVEGAVGDVRLVHAVFSYSLYDVDNIRLRTDADGGALMDVGCYCVSGSRLVGGEPEAAFGEAWLGSSGTDWVFTGTLRFPGDVIAQFDCGTALPNRDLLEVIGSEGSLFLDDPWHARKPVIELHRGGDVERRELPVIDSYGIELENMSEAIRGEAELLLGRADAVGQARTIAALFESAETGTRVRLAP